MITQELEVYSDATNAAIVRMKDRRFPGVVIQGDSLSILLELATWLYEKCKENMDMDIRGDAAELQELLGSYLHHYERVLSDHDMDLPYSTAKQ